MRIKRMDANYTYDSELDIINIQVKQEYTYHESIDFDVGVFLDFDDSYFPVNLEIVDASRRIGVEKEFFTSPDGNVTILIKDDSIEVNVCFKNKSEGHVLKYVNKHFENQSIPNLETDFALI